MTRVREVELPLSEAEVAERPSAEDWRRLIEEAMAMPIPVYDARPIQGVVLPRRDR